jgi:type IV secretion system protein VirB6
MAYSTSAPIKSVIDTVESHVVDMAISGSQAIAETVSPLMAACFGIYLLLVCVNYMRGAAGEPVLDMFIRVACFAIVLTIAGAQGEYAGRVIPILRESGDALAESVMGGTKDETALDSLSKAG